MPTESFLNLQIIATDFCCWRIFKFQPLILRPFLQKKKHKEKKTKPKKTSQLRHKKFIITSQNLFITPQNFSIASKLLESPTLSSAGCQPTSPPPPPNFRPVISFLFLLFFFEFQLKFNFFKFYFAYSYFILS